MDTTLTRIEHELDEMAAILRAIIEDVTAMNGGFEKLLADWDGTESAADPEQAE